MLRKCYKKKGTSKLTKSITVGYLGIIVTETAQPQAEHHGRELLSVSLGKMKGASQKGGHVL